MKNDPKYRFGKVLKNILGILRILFQIVPAKKKYYLINVFVFFLLLFYYLENKSTCYYALNF